MHQTKPTSDIRRTIRRYPTHQLRSIINTLAECLSWFDAGDWMVDTVRWIAVARAEFHRRQCAA